MDFLPYINAGQDFLCNLHLKYLKLLVPHLAKEIEAKGDQIGLEPLLFAYFHHINGKNKNHYKNYLIGLINGYYSDLASPISVYSNSIGEIYVPKVGYFYTDKPSHEFQLLKHPNSEFELFYKTKNIPFTFDSLKYISSEIEIKKSVHPLMEFLITKNDTINSKDLVHLSTLEIRTISSHKEHFSEKAVQILKNHLPEYWSYMEPVAKRVLIFNHHQVRSSTAHSCHGTILISANDFDTLPFFIVEFAHQFGHNILNTIVFHMQNFFKINPQITPLKSLNKNPNEHRTLFSAFHGLYTTTIVAECLETLLKVDGIFSDNEKQELLARFVDNRRRHRTGLQDLDFNSVFTQEGMKLYNFLDTKCFDIYERNKSICDQFDVSNQPFVFNYQKFLEANSNVVTIG